MPRDFVPCLYHEREMYDEVTQTWYVRFAVTECFEKALLATREPVLVITGDSHEYHNSTAFTQQDAVQWPLARDPLARRCRGRLFTTFYAAMAALE